MSIAPSGDVFASVAGSQLAQSAGAEVQRVQQDTANHQRRVAADEGADDAASIAETDGQNHDTQDRDADGRRPWEIAAPKRASVPSGGLPPGPTPSHDANNTCGRSLDLTA